MRKDLNKLIEIAKKHADIIENANGDTLAADAKTITEDVEKVLCGEFGLGSDDLLAKAAKKLDGITLPPEDRESFREKIGKMSSDEAGSLYVSVWRGAMADGNPLSGDNKATLLEILGALGSAVFREVKKLLLIVDRDYMVLGDALLLRQGRGSDVDTSYDFDKLIKSDADRMCGDYGFFSDGLRDILEKEFLAGREPDSLTTEETEGLLSRFADLELAGTLYISVLRGAPCDVSLLDDGRTGLLQKILVNAESEAELVYEKAREFEAERYVVGMTPDKMWDYLKKEERRVDKAYHRTKDKGNDGGKHIFDEMDYGFVFKLAKDKLMVCAVYADKRRAEIRESGENLVRILVWGNVIDWFYRLLREYECALSPF